LNFGYRKKLNN
jgi:pyruvate/2-oxoglutarate dehydrogenase complex dihydrolipoamide dehydrogenase (E3) component